MYYNRQCLIHLLKQIFFMYIISIIDKFTILFLNQLKQHKPSILFYVIRLISKYYSRYSK